MRIHARSTTRIPATFAAVSLAASALAADPPDAFIPPMPSPSAAPAPQPAPTPAPSPAPAPKPATPPGPPIPTASEAILELQAAYRAIPICERVQVEVHYPAPAPATGTRIARSTISVSLSGPAASPDALAEQIVALELGALRIHASHAQLTAVHSRDPATFFQAAIDEQVTSKSLGAVLPPILVPQLDLKTAAPDSPLSAFWPYATDIVWQAVEVDARHPTKRTIRGLLPAGSIALTVHNQRLRSLAIELPTKQTSLILSFSPFGPCDPAKLAIDTARRQRVDCMDELRPRAGTLRVGIRVPHMPITQGITGQPGGGWDMGALLQPPEKAQLAGIKPAGHVVLVFLRQIPLTPSGSAANEPTREQRFSPESLAKILHALREESFKARAAAGSPDAADKDPALGIARFGYAPVLVMGSPNPEELLKKLREANAVWPETLWSTEAKSTIDLFAPTSDAAAIILDSEFVLRGVVPIENHQTAEQVGDQIAASLFELGGADK